MTQFSRKKIISQKGVDLTSIDTRITNLEQNEYKVTYYEIISGASGSITIPTGATINAGEFGLSGNCILSKIDGSNKPTFESPTTSGGIIVTASLDEITGAWVASGTYTDTNVALIYSIKIKAINYSNLTYSNIIETTDDTGNYVKKGTLTTNYIPKATSSDTIGDSNIIDDGTNVGIGLISPTSKVHVQGTDSTASNYALRVDNSASSPLLYVRNDGRVTVGKTFEISRYGFNTTRAFWVEAEVTTENTLMSTSNADLVFKTRSSGTVETMRMTAAGKVIINDGSYLTLGVLDPSTDKYAYIDSAGNATASAGLKFSVCQVGNTTGVTAMQIEAGGNIGIGTTSPIAKLDVNGSIRSENLTASQIVETDASKNLVSSSYAVSDLELISNKSSSYTLSSTTTYANTKALVDGLATKQNSLGYTPEDVANKQTDLTASATKYPTVDAVNTGLANKVTSNASITGATKTKITYDSKGLVTSGTDATTADINDSTNRRYVTDAQLTVIGNTSGTNSGNETTSTLGTTINGATDATPNDTDLVATVESSVVKKITWTNVKAFLKTYFDTLYNPYKYKYLTTSDGSTTSSTTNTLSTSVLVPANTFAVGDLISLQARGFKTGGNGTFTIRLYVNTTNDLSGATLLGTFSSSSIGNTMINIQRFAVIKSSTVTQVPTATSNNANDFVQSTTTSANISHTSDQYYIVALQCTSASDSAVCSYFLLQKQ